MKVQWGKKFFFVTAILVATIIVFGIAIAKSNRPGKVEICHFPPGNFDNFHTITVSKNAVETHLAHGDKLGVCDNHCDFLCDDGNECTIDDYDNCEEEGCDYPRDFVDCDDEDLCTEDSCDSVDGCINTTIDCDDGDPNTEDSCDPATGCINTPVDCDDGDPCTDDSGSPDTGCIYTPKVCDNGDPCTSDICEGGTCVYSEPTVCPEDKFCDPSGTGCVNSPNPGCEGSKCLEFIECNPKGGCELPVCATVYGGGGLCLEGTTDCPLLARCFDGSCPEGSICVVNTCCKDPVCVPSNAWCVNIPETTSVTLKALKAIIIGPTIDGCE